MPTLHRAFCDSLNISAILQPGVQQQLSQLFEMLQIKIAEVIEATNEITESSDYELHTLCQRDPSILVTVGEKHRQQIEAECATLSFGCAPCTKRSSFPIHEALSRWFSACERHSPAVAEVSA